ncbi:ThyX-like thymidylate synthase [Streptomyces phage Sebastisaurus]|uniref:ThyX-like thymidylate synthase n=1 Tax=Streptomyces phage Sebastisaurus TaxID=2510572 RepID=A0A411B3U2_9CAUD|nr:ThyX-like thymidylate synthase [Streptomyces phage Sebastisaurus]
MRVDTLAHTALNTGVMFSAYEYDVWGPSMAYDADALGEAAGRLCYKSFDRPNPNTARNADYMANILAQGHYSVLEHSSVTFLVRGVSRALLTELTRHRHLSFSVVSQRYVDYANTSPVLPPALADVEPESQRANMRMTVEGAYAFAVKQYEELVRKLRDQGLNRKQAREAARAVLPNAAPVDMVVTGNLRAWRDVLGKRHHVAADKEIQEFAGLVLAELRKVAPNSVQDVPDEPYE